MFKGNVTMFKVGDVVTLFPTTTSTTYVEYEIQRINEDSTYTLRRIDGGTGIIHVWFDASQMDKSGLVPVYDDIVVFSSTKQLGYMIDSYKSGFHMYRVRLIKNIASYLNTDASALFIACKDFTDDELIGFVQAAEAVHLYVTKANL